MGGIRISLLPCYIHARRSEHGVTSTARSVPARSLSLSLPPSPVVRFFLSLLPPREQAGTSHTTHPGLIILIENEFNEYNQSV